MQKINFNALMSLGQTANMSQDVGFGNRETNISQVREKIT